MSGTYLDLIIQLANAESSSNYGIENSHGYLGRYQFGEKALDDAGYYNTENDPTDGDITDQDWLGTWIGKNSVWNKEDFLANPIAQDDALQVFYTKVWGYIKSAGLDIYAGQTINGIKITESGLLAGYHLKGLGNSVHPGLRDYLISGGNTDPADANGTPISSYISQFSGYDTPFTANHDRNDLLMGGSGHDEFDGGRGNDVLVGAGGDDFLKGGEGTDIFSFNSFNVNFVDGNDTISDNDGLIFDGGSELGGTAERQGDSGDYKLDIGGYTYHFSKAGAADDAGDLVITREDSNGAVNRITVQDFHNHSFGINLKDNGNEDGQQTPPPDLPDAVKRLFSNAALLIPHRIDPLVLDLNQNGVQLVNVAASHAFFDFDGDGIATKTGWLSPQDGFLGGHGNDTLSGGSGNDTYHFSATGDGSDTITDSDGSGKIEMSAADGTTIEFTLDGVATKESSGFYRLDNGHATLSYNPTDHTLQILAWSGKTDQSTITLQNFHSGDLGITLADGGNPPPPQQTGGINGGSPDPIAPPSPHTHMELRTETHEAHDNEFRAQPDGSADASYIFGAANDNSPFRGSGFCGSIKTG